MDVWICIQVWQLIIAAVACALGGAGLFLTLFGDSAKIKLCGATFTIIGAGFAFCILSMPIVAGGGGA